MKIHKNLHTKNKLGGVNENSQEYAQVANLEVYMKIHKNMLNWPTWKPKWKFKEICEREKNQLESKNENSHNEEEEEEKYTWNPKWNWQGYAQLCNLKA